MSSSSQSLTRELSAAGVKSPGTFSDVRFGPFIFSVMLTDNAIVNVDLRTAASIADAQLDALGGTAANPPIYLIVNGYRLSFASGTENGEINRQIQATPYLHHEPSKGPQRDIMLAPGTGTVAAATGATAVLICAKAGVQKLKNPLLVAMRREVFELRYLNIVNTTANINGTLELYGYAMPDDVALSPVQVDCVSDSEAVSIGRTGIKGASLI